MPSPSSPFPTRVRVAIVGAGFSGLCIRARRFRPEQFERIENVEIAERPLRAARRDG